MEEKKLELVTVREAAKILDVEPRAIYYMIQVGRLQPVQTCPYLFIRQDVECLTVKKKSNDVEMAIDPKGELNAPFGSITWDFDESFKLLDLFHDPKFPGNPLKYYTTKHVSL